MTKRSADTASDLAIWAIFKVVVTIAAVFVVDRLPALRGSAAALGNLERMSVDEKAAMSCATAEMERGLKLSQKLGIARPYFSFWE